MKRFALLLMLAVALRCYAQWAENKHSEEMTSDEREGIYTRLKRQRVDSADLEDFRRQVRYNHGQGEHRNVELFEGEGYVVITDRTAEQ